MVNLRIINFRGKGHTFLVAMRYMKGNWIKDLNMVKVDIFIKMVMSMMVNGNRELSMVMEIFHT